MPLQFELAKSYRRIVVEPVLPSVTVGAVTGMTAPNACISCVNLHQSRLMEQQFLNQKLIPC
jgi:hypothetical protein